MNKKKIVFVSGLVFIILAVLMSLYYIANAKNETNKKQANMLISNIFKQEVLNNVIVELHLENNIIKEATNEELNQSETIDTEEKNNQKSNTSSSKKNNTQKETSKKSNTNSTKKEEPTNTQKKTTVTVEAAGEYDIKNGGTAIYTESVEMPQEWLDY